MARKIEKKKEDGNHNLQIQVSLSASFDIQPL
jgi:hypothetical protein